MRRLFTLSISFLLVSFVTAQITNPQSGYYVEGSGDTTYATIDRNDDLNLSFGISVVENGEIITIPANEVRAVGFNVPTSDYRTVSFVTREESSPEKDTVTRLAKILIDHEAVELLQLRIGGVDYSGRYTNTPPYVYYLRLPEGKQYFLEQEEVSEGVGFYQLRDHYKGVLKYAMRDWPEGADKIERTQFRAKGLMKLISEYLDEAHGDISLSTEVEDNSSLVVSRRIGLAGNSRLKLEEATIDNFGLGSAFEVVFYDPGVANNLYLSVGLEYYQLLKDDIQGAGPGSSAASGGIASVPISGRFYLTQGRAINVFFSGGMNFTLFNDIEISGSDYDPPPFRFTFGGGVGWKRANVFYRRARFLRNTIGLSYDLN